MHYHMKDKCLVVFLQYFSRLFAKVFLKNANVFHLTKLSLAFYEVNITIRRNTHPKHWRVCIHKSGQKKVLHGIFAQMSIKQKASAVIFRPKRYSLKRKTTYHWLSVLLPSILLHCRKQLLCFSIVVLYLPFDLMSFKPHVSTFACTLPPKLWS